MQEKEKKLSSKEMFLSFYMQQQDYQAFDTKKTSKL